MKSDLKRTPLHDVHKKAEATMDNVDGWEMPIQYSSVLEEHEAVRLKAGLFDISHMGKVFIFGEDAEKFLQTIVTNDVAKLNRNKAQYNVLCYPDGGTVDDVLIYKLEEDKYVLLFNTSTVEKDVEWMKEHLMGDVVVRNFTEEVSLLAVQGPNAQALLQTLTLTDLSEIEFHGCKQHVDLAGSDVLVTRSGYTGEDGFQLILGVQSVESIWQAIMAAGQEYGLLPCGMGARDTLRVEANLPLYGQELTKNITPLEAGIGVAVETKKEIAFVGQEDLSKQKEEGSKRKIAGIKMMEAGVPDTDDTIYSLDGSENIGHVTSGTHSPTLRQNIGLALLHRDYSEVGTEILVDIQDKKVAAKVVKTPFYKREEADAGS